MPITDFEFSTSLIKGRVVETIFQQMFVRNTPFTVLPLGYENIVPELVQCQHRVKDKAVLENIRNIPDFLLIGKDKEQVFLVETKYRHRLDLEEIITTAQKINSRWNPTFLFVSTQDTFYFDLCSNIINNHGVISKLDLIEENVQIEYIKVLQSFLH